MNLQFTVSLGITLAIGAINAYQTYLTRAQLRLQQDAIAHVARRNTTYLVIPWRYAYGPTLAMVLLAGASWLPYLFRAPLDPMPRAPYVFGFGTTESFDETNPILWVGANGNLLYSHRDGYRIAAVAFRYYADGDVNDVSNLQKSGLYDIRDGQELIYIRVDKQFLQTILRGEKHTVYYLLLVPDKIQLYQFATLRQAESLGVITMQAGVGPP